MPTTEHLVGSGGVFLHEASIGVNLGGLTLFITPDQVSADHIARLLNMARESKHHTGMNILTQQLFLGEEAAKLVLYMLHEENQPIGVANGKPN